MPAGWRIPTIADYNKLMGNFTTKKDTDGNYVGNFDETLALRSTSDWSMLYSYDRQGTNTSGFNAFPAGYYTDYPQNNETPQNLAMFLTATPLPAAKANTHATHYTFIVTRLYANFSSDDYTGCFSCFVSQGFNNIQPKSVRFVRDF
nr:FISUMP domain-containing protein [uncultured Mucilaginibacter sp.]